MEIEEFIVASREILELGFRSDIRNRKAEPVNKGYCTKKRIMITET